jgi:hypothetical protein
MQASGAIQPRWRRADAGVSGSHLINGQDAFRHCVTRRSGICALTSRPDETVALAAAALKALLYRPAIIATPPLPLAGAVGLPQRNCSVRRLRWDSWTKNTARAAADAKTKPELTMRRGVPAIAAVLTACWRTSLSYREESIMNDDQVNAEELEQSRRRREAAENATDDGMPVVPEDKERDAEETQSITPKQWVRHTGNGRRN